MIVPKDIKTLLFWLRVKETHTGRFPSCVDDLLLSMHKSALLQRMLEGKMPLGEPPPLSFSYPWYSLIEEGVGHPQDVFKTEGLEFNFFGEAIIINQYCWNLVEEVGPENWVVNYNFGADNENVSRDKWNVYRQEDNNWIIKKII